MGESDKKITTGLPRFSCKETEDVGNPTEAPGPGGRPGLEATPGGQAEHPSCKVSVTQRKTRLSKEARVVDSRHKGQ